MHPDAQAAADRYIKDRGAPFDWSKNDKCEGDRYVVILVDNIKAGYYTIPDEHKGIISGYFTLFVVDTWVNIHICSFTPTWWAEEIQNVVTYTSEFNDRVYSDDRKVAREAEQLRDEIEDGLTHGVEDFSGYWNVCDVKSGYWGPVIESDPNEQGDGWREVAQQDDLQYIGDLAQAYRENCTF
jgi:hypothetical protein